MKKLLATLATLTLLACSAQAQSTNQVGFLFSISEDSMRTITNAWRTHQAAVRLDRTNYGGYAVERVLTVTNEATGQGFFTNRVTWANPGLSVAQWRQAVATRMRLDQQLVEAAKAMDAAAAAFIAPPIVATNSTETP